MNRFRNMLRENRIFILTLVAFNLYTMAEGHNFVFAHEVRQQKQDRDLRAFSSVFGIPIEDLRGHREPLLDRLEPSLSRVEELIRDAWESVALPLSYLSAIAPAGEHRTDAASPQEPSGPSSVPRKELDPRLLERLQRGTEDSDKEQSGRLVLKEDAPLPWRQVEKKARTEKATVAVNPRAASSALAPASVPRRAIPKDAPAPEIVALAHSLGDSPGRIFRFVHDEIDFDPKWGADKSPLGTLQERRGSSWDQAWLLQQLLTAAGVDARLEWGEVEIATPMLTNITGVDDAFRAGDLLTTAGVPIVLFVDGSRVVGARMSHVWVKAHLDYIPNRGATPGPGDTWVRMDPSLKRFGVGGGVRLDEEVPFDLGDYLQSGTLLSPRAFYEDALQAYVDANNLGVASLEELKPSKSLIAEAFPFVPGTLRAKILTVAGEATDVPAAFQQQLEVQVREAGGAVLLTWSTPWPAVYGQRLELAWPGATSADQSTLDLNGGVFATPPYEVDLRPVLRVGGADVASGGPIGSAEDVELLATLTPPQGSPTVAFFEMFAGEHAIFTVDFGRIPQETVDRYTAERDATTDADEEEAWALALAGAVYLRSLGGDLEQLSALRYRRLVEIGNVVLAVQRGAVSTAADGTPLTFSAAPPSLDLGSMVLGLFAADGVVGPPSTSVSTLELLGSQGSAREGEALTAALGGQHLTAVGFLTRAVREDQSLTRVDDGNVNAALAAAELSDEAEAVVRGGVERGLIAWISETQLPFLGWDATGYVLEDPLTGGGGYFVTFERRIQQIDGAVIFHAPQDLDSITAPTDVVATIDQEDLESWTLSYRKKPDGPPVAIATGVGPVTNTTLGQLDPTGLLNGLYELLLTGRDTLGNVVTGRISVVVEGELKLGNFTLPFVDLTLPVLGIDLQVIRTYDSRDKETRDFGVGWRLGLSEVQLQESVPVGLFWQGTVSPGPFPSYCIVPTRGHIITIVLPGDEILRFQPTLSPACQALVPQQVVTLEYTPHGRTRGRLEPLDRVLQSLVVGSFPGPIELWDQFVTDIHDAASYRLTTDDGRIFVIHDQEGLRTITDRNGNVLSITPHGIEHSAGLSVSFQRDPSGRITSISDPVGNELVYSYNNDGDLESVLDQAGQLTTFTYHPDHYLHKILLPDGREVLAAEYDGDGRLIARCNNGECLSRSSDRGASQEAWTDAGGRVTRMTYDSRGNVTALTESSPEGDRTYTLTYNELGQVTRVVDPVGDVTVKTYDSRGNQLSVTSPVPAGADPEDFTTRFTYDGSNRLTSAAFPSGLAFSAQYDARGNLISLEDDEGRVVETRTYLANGTLTSETDGFGTFTYADFDAAGRPQTITDPLGSVLTSQYDANGNVLSYAVDGGSPATLAYDGRNRLLTAQFPSGSDLTYTYAVEDAWKRQESSTQGAVERLSDVNGRFTGMEVRGRVQTSYSYDLSDRPILARGPMGRDTAYEYDPFGQVSKIIAPNGGETRFERDAVGRVLEEFDALGNQRSMTYHAGGLVATFTDARRHTWSTSQTPRTVTTTDPLGRTSITELDKYGSPSKLRHPDGAERTMTYLGDVPLGDEGRYVETIVDEGGHTRRFQYDGSGVVSSVTDLSGAAYQMETVDTTTTLTAPNGETVVFGSGESFYTTQFGDGGTTRFDLTVDSQIGRLTYPSGSSLDFSYDGFGRRVSRTDSSTSEVHSLTWNAADELVQTVDALGTTEFVYDDLGNLIRQRATTGEEIVYQRDLLGRVTHVELWAAGATAPARVVDYSYDANGNLTSVEDPVAGVTTLRYDDVDRLIERELPNGIITEYGYDRRDRVTSVVHRTAAGVTLLSLTYERRGLGEPSRITREDGSYALYEYDAAVRLTREAYFDADDVLIEERLYTYDLGGNRLTRDLGNGVSTYIYDPGFQLRTVSGSDGTESYAYDADGRLASATRDAETRTFGYATDGRLLSVAGSAGTVSYRYDAAGRRVRADEGTTARRFLVAPAAQASMDRPHLVTGDTGTVLAGYLYAGEEPLLRFDDDGETFYLTDAMGSVIGLADASGAVTARFDYGAFGDVRSAGGSFQAVAGGDFRFHGTWLDANTGLYQMGEREYDAHTGRFLTRDPVGPDLDRPESTNPYLFAHANPLLFKDPSGLFSIMSVNISMSIRGILSAIRTIALHQIRQQVKDKILEAIGRVVVNQLVGFLPIDVGDVAGSVLDLADEVAEYAEFWQRVELGVKRGICWIFNDSPWIYFEPRVRWSSGKITHDGYSCPPQGKTRNGASAGAAFPDFYISSARPSQNSGGLVLGEVKASVKGAYYTWVRRRSGGSFFRPQQLQAFTRHVVNYVPSRLLVVVAFNDGPDAMKIRILSKMQENGLVAGIIVALR